MGPNAKRATMAISGIVLTLAAVGQIVLAFVLYNETGNEVVRYVGWAIMCMSAIFGWLPMLTLKRRGGVPKGRPYVETTLLVNRGLYAIVRHPQYLAGVLLGIGFGLIAQHWLVGVLGALVVFVSYAGTYPEERRLRRKFGEEYDEYAKRVPRMNFVWGLARLVRQRGGSRE